MTAPAKPVVERVPGKFERLFYERQARDLALCALPSGHPKGFVFNAAAGERVVRFIEKFCKHHEGAFSGRPFILQPWQRDLITTAFGWKRADGTRRYRTMYCAVPRKNGKSEIAAAIALYLLVNDNEQGAQVYSSATTRGQSKIVWQAASRMVEKSPGLKKFVESFKTSLVVERTGSKFEPLSSEANTLDGLNPHGNVIDELHAWPDPHLYEVLDSAMGSRRQPVTFIITTAGLYDPESIGVTMHEHAQKVLEGVIEDDQFFAVIYAADEEDDPFSEATLRKANPNFDVSVKGDYLLAQAEKAQRQPSFQAEYLSKHICRWTQQQTKWLSLERWAECEPALPPGADAFALAQAREKALEGRTAYGGLDLSSRRDLTALVLAIPGADNVIDLVCRAWLPQGTIDEAAKRGQRFYAEWQRAGFLSVSPGEIIDHEFIRAEINALAKRFKLVECAFDPWNCVDLATRLTNDGRTMIEVRQGFRSLSEPSKAFEAKIFERKVRHANNPILKFCVSNAVAVVDSAGNVRPDKSKATDRIDLVVAAVMALSRTIVAAPAPVRSSLLDQGGLWL